MAKKSERRRILAVVTNVPEYSTSGIRTGLWLGELTHFYDEATAAGHEVVIASIDGGFVPIDPESLAGPVLAMGGTKKRYEDRAFMNLLKDTPSVASMKAGDFDAIYLTGGHGTMYDFTGPLLSGLVSEFWTQGKIVSAVCHGPAGLLHAVDADGSPIVRKRKVTGFSWPEEKLAGRADVVPFDLSEALKDQGAKYTKTLRPMAKNVVVDGRLITGQNPMSAKAVAKAVLKAFDKS